MDFFQLFYSYATINFNNKVFRPNKNHNKFYFFVIFTKLKKEKQ